MNRPSAQPEQTNARQQTGRDQKPVKLEGSFAKPPESGLGYADQPPANDQVVEDGVNKHTPAESAGKTSHA